MLKTHLNKNRGIAGLIIGIGLVGAAVVTSLPGPTPSASYIVQGASLAAVKAAVQTVGGEISHELGIIKSVGAKLSDRQMQALQGMAGIRRVYENSGLSTSTTEPGCTVFGGPEIKFGSGDWVDWRITNTGGVAIHLDSAMILWPASNNRLEEIENGRDTISNTDVYGISATFEAADWQGEDKDLRISTLR